MSTVSLARIVESDVVFAAINALRIGEHITRDAVTIAHALLRALRAGDIAGAERIAEDASRALEAAAELPHIDRLEALMVGRLFEAVFFSGWAIKTAREFSEKR